MEGLIVSSGDVLYYVDYSILGKRGYLNMNISEYVENHALCGGKCHPKYLLAETF
jgi:hypothetical protein